MSEVFNDGGKALEDAILSLEDERLMVERAEHFIRERLPERDENVALINRIVERIITDREITKVDDLVSRFSINKRKLERIFMQNLKNRVSPAIAIADIFQGWLKCAKPFSSTALLWRH